VLINLQGRNKVTLIIILVIKTLIGLKLIEPNFV